MIFSKFKVQVLVHLYSTQINGLISTKIESFQSIYLFVLMLFSKIPPKRKLLFCDLTFVKNFIGEAYPGRKTFKLSMFHKLYPATDFKNNYGAIKIKN